ncbi:putative bifunctional diguanylate cyclase/phosphodiesterase [Paenibacillus tepidiphilus]|uniref:putative bifunctional diguanylate cyclase/phosphodiesterase n=1 Tax=Paenibacillus tepidiphilus TaxID=2608683 RepID=UPI00123C260C|nr:EAL domain-containing protein [Paenibacillus tepidiphilus]
MKLRTKFIIYITILAMLALGLTYLLLHLILLDRFEHLDEAALHGKLDDAVASYQNELQSMKTGLLRYSLSDGTRRLIESGNAEDPDNAAYLHTTFGKTTFELNRFDVIALLNREGQPLFGGVHEPGADIVSPLTDEHLALIKLINGRLPAFTNNRSDRSGIVNLADGPMLVTLTPIAGSDGAGPSVGTALAGRRLQQEEITRIWRGTQSTFQIARVTSGMLASSGGGTVWMNSGPDGLMSIHTVVDDLFGNPGIVISLKAPRQIYEGGLQSINRFRMFFFASTLLICGFSLMFVNRFILGRMRLLIRNIRTIGRSKDLSFRIRRSGKDEFSDVEQEFNRMIDSLEQAQKELRLQSMLDPLTQLPSRSLFFTKLNEAISAVRGTGRMMGLVFIDLDHFKTVNDTLGHDIGDGLLREVAGRITQSIGKQDVVSRLGGDEFTILFADVESHGDLMEQLSRLQTALTRPHRVQGHLLYCTASIGVSLYPQNGEDAEYLVKQADLAMFHVKENGRNNIFQYSEVLEESIRRKKVLSRQLLSAAANGEFEVHYQPIVSSGHLAVSKAEALLRWNSPTYGSVSPAEFIPLAETSGCIVGIGAWVLRQVCADMRRLRDLDLALTAAVNISAVQLMQPGLPELLLELLGEFQLPVDSLELEITESVLVSGESIHQSLLQLRSLGFRISLDDFGTGFSSLSYLRRLPLDVIKIDRSFISGMTLGKEGDVLVKAIIELSHSLGLSVVSEGVEYKEQFDMLRRMGSDELQGYHIGRPVRFAELFSFLLQDRALYDKM